MLRLIAVVVVLLFASPVFAAGKPCEELKSEIDAKLKENKVDGYTLEIVANDDVKDQKVIGTCEGGTKKIVYTRDKK